MRDQESRLKQQSLRCVVCPVLYVRKASPGVTSGSEKVKCAGVRSGRCGWEERRGEERGMGLKKAVWRKDEKESRRRASSTL